VVLVFARRGWETSPVRPGACWSFSPTDFRREQVHVRAVRDGLQFMMGYSDIDPSRHNVFRTYGSFPDSESFRLEVK
jgi:hypothetical protein